MTKQLNKDEEEKNRPGLHDGQDIPICGPCPRLAR